MVGLDIIVVGLAQGKKSFMHCILDKPCCSSGLVRHQCTTLDLDVLGRVVEMDSYSARRAMEQELEGDQQGLLSASLVQVWSNF